MLNMVTTNFNYTYIKIRDPNKAKINKNYVDYYTYIKIRVTIWTKIKRIR